MLVGVPKEIKDHEHRVGLIPSTVRKLASKGHRVLVETGAGRGAGISDDDYVAAGAEIVVDANQVFDRAELIVKVKEPLEEERKHLKRGQVLFTYLHLTADLRQTEELIATGVSAIAYETVTSPQGTLPLLIPMSEVAGRMAPQVGAHYLERENGGRGVPSRRSHWCASCDVVILGSGVVGTNAALIALGMGANVTMAGHLNSLRRAAAQLGSRLHTVVSARKASRKSMPLRRPHHRRGAGTGRQGAEANFSRDGEGHGQAP